jgi:putative oxidoreductase
MDNLKSFMVPLGRLLLGALFVWAGIVKVHHPGAVAPILAGFHVPAPDVMVWVSGIFEIIVGLAVLVGFKTRWAAALLALYCIGIAFGAHLPAGDMGNMAQFYKDLAIAGGFLYVVAYGSGGISIDGRAA